MDNYDINLLEEYLFDSDYHDVLFCDDLADQLTQIPSFCKFYTAYCHHKTISTFLSCHNLYEKTKLNRTIQINSDIIILFKNWRDSSFVRTLSLQMFPRDRKSSFLVDAYNQSTGKDDYAYIVLNLQNGTPESLRFRGNIFPDATLDVYVPSN